MTTLKHSKSAAKIPAPTWQRAAEVSLSTPEGFEAQPHKDIWFAPIYSMEGPHSGE